MKIQITLDNDQNNLPRTAEFTDLYWNTDVQQIVVKCRYGVYQNDEFTYGTNNLQMVASNTTFVNTQGAPVPADTDGAIGEYDFFMMMIKNPINLPELIQTYMNKAKLQGKFNN